MIKKLSTAGNSDVLIISKDIKELTGIDKYVEISVEGNKTILSPIRKDEINVDKNGKITKL